jgi:hypothetical protein
MDSHTDLEEILKVAQEALLNLEKRAAGFTSLTIPSDLSIDLQHKRQEVENLRTKIKDFNKSSLEKVDDTIKSSYNSKSITYRDLLEQELNLTILRDMDLPLAVNLCNSILITCQQALYTFSDGGTSS